MSEKRKNIQIHGDEQKCPRITDTDETPQPSTSTCEDVSFTDDTVTGRDERAVESWAKAFKISPGTIRLLAEDGFTSLEALELLTEDDLLSTKIPRGQQKLVLKGVFTLSTDKARAHGPSDQPSYNNHHLTSTASRGGHIIRGNLIGRGGVIAGDISGNASVQFVSGGDGQRDAKKESERYQKMCKVSEGHVQTSLYHEVLGKLENTGSVTVLGNAGDGKTTLLHLVCLEYSTRGYLTIEIDLPENIHRYLDSDKPVLFVCDSLLGRIMMDHDKKKSWINSEYEKITSDKVKVLFACRLELWRQHEKQLKQNPMFKDTVDVRSENLTYKDKTEIINKHFAEKMSHDTKWQIVRHSNFAFPLCCKFVSESEDIDFTDIWKLVKTFNNPFRSVMTTLEAIRENNKRQYATLMLCLLNERKLPTTGKTDIVKQPNFKVVRNLYLSDRTCSIEQMYDEMLDNAKWMDGWLLTHIGDYYDFYHDSIFEAFCRVHGDRYPEHILDVCEPESVLTMFTTKQLSGSDRMFLPPRCYLKLCEIVTEECVKGRVRLYSETWRFVFAEMKTAHILKQWHKFLSQRLSGVCRVADTTATNPRLYDVLLLLTELPDSKLTVDDAFEYAAEHGDTETARLLIDTVTSSGRALGLDCAVSNGHSDTVRMIVERVDLDVCDIVTGLENGVLYDRVKCVREILRVHRDIVTDIDSGIDTDTVQDMFNWAADKGHIDIVEIILKLEDVDTEEKRLVQTMVSDSVESIREIVREPDIDTDKLHYVFVWAAGKGHSDIVKMMVEGGDLEMIYTRGLEKAVRYDRVQCVREIMKVHPDIDTDVMQNVFDWAADKRHVDIVRMILKLEDVATEDKGLHQNVVSDSVQCIKQIMREPDTHTDKLHYVFYWAVGEGHVGLVKMAVQRGKVDMWDIKRGLERAVSIDSVDCVREILSVRYDIDRDTIHGLLERAVCCRSVKTLAELVKHQAVSRDYVQALLDKYKMFLSRTSQSDRDETRQLLSAHLNTDT